MPAANLSAWPERCHSEASCRSGVRTSSKPTAAFLRATGRRERRSRPGRGRASRRPGGAGVEGEEVELLAEPAVGRPPAGWSDRTLQIALRVNGRWCGAAGAAGTRRSSRRPGRARAAAVRRLPGGGRAGDRERPGAPRGRRGARGDGARAAPCPQDTRKPPPALVSDRRRPCPRIPGPSRAPSASATFPSSCPAATAVARSTPRPTGRSTSASCASTSPTRCTSARTPCASRPAPRRTPRSRRCSIPSC